MKYKKILILLLTTVLTTNLYADTNNKGFKIEGGEDKIGLGKEYTEPITAVKVKAIFANNNTKRLITPNLPQKSAYLKKLQGLSSTEGKAGAMGMNNEAGLNTSQNGTQTTNPNGSTTTGNKAQGLKAILEDCYWFYYNEIGHYANTEINVGAPYKTRADCTGLACYFMSSVSGKQVTLTDSTSYLNPGQDVLKQIEGCGWKKHSVSELKSVNDLQLGDVLICRGHAYIYYDTTGVMSWGDNSQIKNYVPNVKAQTKLVSNYLLIGGDDRQYTVFYRHEG